MNIQSTAKVVFGSIRKVSPLIFSGIAIIGVGATAYFAAKENKKAVPIAEKIKSNKIAEVKAPKKEVAKMGLDLAFSYRWAILCGVGTIGCICASTAISWIRIKQTTDALLATEKIFQQYKKAVLATGASSVAIGEEMAKQSERDIPDEASEDDGKILIYDMSNAHWFRSTEADVYRAIIHLNELIDCHGIASVEDFYKALECKAPTGSDLRGWYVWSDQWFNDHSGEVTIRFSFNHGHKTDDGLEYWLLEFYDDPMYHTELGASMDQCLEERRKYYNYDEADLEEYRNHDA